jgi:uncharacterized membrane protein
MSNWWKPICFGLVLALLAHVATTMAIPRVIMDIAIERIAEASGGTNRLQNNPLVTPQNQRIVRSSPDLAYSTCALDLSQGPVRVFIGKGSDYASAAFYGANTDSVFTLSDTSIGPNGAYILVQTQGAQIPAAPSEVVVTLPSQRGLMLVRRLAPSNQAMARVEVERAKDSCIAVAAAQK